MSGEAKKILKYLNRNSSKKQQTEHFKLLKHINIEEEIFDTAINELLEKQLIIDNQILYSDSYSTKCYYSSKRGKKYFFNIKLLFVKKAAIFIICNILIPIFVAYITSIITCNQCSNNTNQNNKQNMTEKP